MIFVKAYKITMQVFVGKVSSPKVDIQCTYKFQKVYMYLKTYTGMLPTYKYHSNFIRFIKLCFSNSDTKNNTSEKPKSY